MVSKHLIRMTFPLCYIVSNFPKNARENNIVNWKMVIKFMILVPYFTKYANLGLYIEMNNNPLHTFFQAVLPEDCNIKNFTSDWNNGINFSALIDYCKPGLMPNWRSFDPNNSPENSKKAINLFQIFF